MCALLTALLQRFCNEVHMCNLLRHRGVDIVPLVGVCLTETHPLVLVYEYADNLDLRHYVRNEPNVRRLDLVRTPTYTPPLYQPLMLLDNSL
jgi:serine/threonine protein kinase